MQIAGNKYFMLSLLILLVGVELRLVETFVLNTDASRFVRQKLSSPTAQSVTFIADFFPAAGSYKRQSVKPPKWIGCSLISIGAVCILHSFVMRKKE